MSFRDDINGYMVCSMENNSTEEVSKTPGEEIKRDENVKDCEDNEVDLNDLVAEIEKALVASGKSSNTELTVHDLIDSYRRYHKRELDLAKYKLISVDQLLCKLRTMGRVRINESDNTFSFFSAETSPEVTSRFSNLLRRPKTSLFSLKPEDNTQVFDQFYLESLRPIRNYISENKVREAGCHIGDSGSKGRDTERIGL